MILLDERLDAVAGSKRSVLHLCDVPRIMLPGQACCLLLSPVIRLACHLLGLPGQLGCVLGLPLCFDYLLTFGLFSCSGFTERFMRDLATSKLSKRSQA